MGICKTRSGAATTRNKHLLDSEYSMSKNCARLLICEQARLSHQDLMMHGGLGSETQCCMPLVWSGVACDACGRTLVSRNRPPPLSNVADLDQRMLIGGFDGVEPRSPPETNGPRNMPASRHASPIHGESMHREGGACQGLIVRAEQVPGPAQQS